MKPTLLMTCSLWITFALFIAIAVMARGYFDGVGLAVFCVAGVIQLSMALRCTRSYLRGEAYPAGWEPEGGIGFKRRERVRARMASRGRSPR